jgi:hypothetical protein
MILTKPRHDDNGPVPYPRAFVLVESDRFGGSAFSIPIQSVKTRISPLGSRERRMGRLLEMGPCASGCPAQP